MPHLSACHGAPLHVRGRTLTLEGDAVRSMLRHGSLPPEAQQGGQILPPNPSTPEAHSRPSVNFRRRLATTVFGRAARE
jgi:hypothetical protein